MANLRMQQTPLSGLSELAQANRSKRSIALVLLSGFSFLPAGAVAEALHLANVLSDRTSNAMGAYDIHFLSASGGPVPSTSSVRVGTIKCEAHRHHGSFHAVFVAGGTGVLGSSDHARHFDCLRPVVERAEMVFPIGDGWRLPEEVGPPWLRFHMTRTIQNSDWGNRSGAVHSPVDAVLGLIERDLGGEIAGQIARRIESPLRSLFLTFEGKRMKAALSEPIQTAARWLETNAIKRTITINDASQAAFMNTRTFLRRFKAETGLTPSEYLLRVRIELCCRMLAGTNLPVDKVARRCGIGNGSRLSKIFRNHLGRTPTEYRAMTQSSHDQP
jgi:transcriptional regulator GlxA family with amidase domain